MHIYFAQYSPIFNPLGGSLQQANLQCLQSIPLAWIVLPLCILIYPCVPINFKIKPTPLSLHLSVRHAGKVWMCTFSLSSRISSQELSICCRIGHCKSLPTTQLSPDPAQAPQCPPQERWLRLAFRSALFLLSSSGWSFEQGASPLPCGPFFLFRRQMC